MNDTTDYLNRIAREKLLTPEEEILLGRQVANAQQLSNCAPDQLTREQKNIIREGAKARERLVAANLRLCYMLAKKHAPKRSSLTVLDLAQEGAISLHNAAERFDYTRGYKFSTYAYWWIRQGITRAINQKDAIIRLPCHVSQSESKFKRVASIAMAKGENISPEQLAKDNNVNYEHVKYAARTRVVSLDACIAYNNEEKTPLIELIADDRAMIEESHPLVDLLPPCLNSMEEEYKTILKLRFIEGLNCQEIGKRLGLTAPSVSKKTQVATEKLKRLLMRQSILSQPEFQQKLPI